MWTILLAGCDLSGTTKGSLDTSGLWEVEDGRFQAFRHLDPADYGDTGSADALDETDLLFAMFETGGCASGDGWRMGLRTGEVWESGAAVGAIHFDDGDGLAICGWESASGELTSFDPEISLWQAKGGLKDEESTTSDDWTVATARAQDVPTYFGVFPETISFTLQGNGALDGWVLHFADGFGLVLMRNDTFAADLVYTR